MSVHKMTWCTENGILHWKIRSALEQADKTSLNPVSHQRETKQTLSFISVQRKKLHSQGYRKKWTTNQNTGYGSYIYDIYWLFWLASILTALWQPMLMETCPGWWRTIKGIMQLWTCLIIGNLHICHNLLNDIIHISVLSLLSLLFMTVHICQLYGELFLQQFFRWITCTVLLVSWGHRFLGCIKCTGQLGESHTLCILKLCH